jgi:hypothetical protein
MRSILPNDRTPVRGRDSQLGCAALKRILKKQEPNRLNILILIEIISKEARSSQSGDTRRTFEMASSITSKEANDEENICTTDDRRGSDGCIFNVLFS